jgi:hypothetical protein
VQAELDSPVGLPRPRRLRRDCGVDLFDSAELIQQLARGNWLRTRPSQLHFVDFAVIDRRARVGVRCRTMLNRYRCAPGPIEMAEGAPMFVDCMLKLPAWPLLNPLVAAIGHVHVCPRASHPIECRVSTGPAQCLRAPRFQELAVLIKLGDARNALAVGTRTSPAAFQVTAVGRAAKVKVIVESAGVHRTGSPAPAHPRPPHPTRCPGLPRRRLQGHRGRVRLRPSVNQHACGRSAPSRGRPATTVLKLEKLSAGSESRPWYAV